MIAEHPNWFAYIALLSWPLVTAILFRVMRPVEALLWTILGAQMFLPEMTELKVEMLPAIDKTSMASLCAATGCLLTAPRVNQRIRFDLSSVLVITYFLAPLITSYLNGDVVMSGGHALPGVGLYDGVSASISQFFLILPLFFGRRYLAGEQAIESILRVLVIAGLIYSLLILFEVRMSPQLHRWVYGFSPSNMLTERRFGGFRPVVFMSLGLITSFFALTTAIAAVAVWRASRPALRAKAALVAGYLGVVVVFCKSSGVLAYSIVVIPLVRWARPRVQVTVAVIIVSIALSYPVVRYLGWFPEKGILEVVDAIVPDRTFSLQTRFRNEDELLARASERAMFGWGRYGRNRIYEEGSGMDVSLTDGRWIITFGMWGAFGFIAEFGLLALAVFRAASACKLAEGREQIFLAALTLISAVTLFEQLPNASIRPWTWLVAGALMGQSDTLVRRVKRTTPSRASQVSQPAVQ